MNIITTLERTRTQLLAQVNREELTPAQKKIFIRIIKGINLSKVYKRWVNNGSENGEFQELLADSIKFYANKIIKNAEEENEQLSLNIVYNTIPA